MTSRSALYPKSTFSKRTSLRACGNRSGCVGSGTPGSSSRTPDSFSSADEADWKVLKNWLMSCIGSKNIRR